MKEITLRSLELWNFKGIKYRKVDCGRHTNILGNNGTGKTTLFDAYRWLLFGKDSTDRAQFEIKTQNEAGEAIHGLEHKVEGVLTINERTKTFTKTYREKWTKKRGTSEATFTGHETVYEIDGVPMQAKDYTAEVEKIMPEMIFKLLSDPLFFAHQMDWQSRRDIVMEFAGRLTKDEIIDEKLEEIRALLDFHENDVERAKASLTSKKRKLNEEIKLIPARIDEAAKTIRELDFKTLKKELMEFESELKAIDEETLQLSDSEETDDEKELKKLRGEKRKLTDISEQDYREKIDAAKREIWKLEEELTDADNTLSITNRGINQKKLRIDSLEERIKELAKEWDDVKSHKFHIEDGDFVCPTCKRLLDSEVIEEKKKTLRENFNRELAKQLDKINEEGKKASDELKRLRADIELMNQRKEKEAMAIAELRNRLEEAREKKVSLETAGINYPDLSVITKRIEELTENIRLNDKTEKFAEIRTKRNDLIRAIDRTKDELRVEKSNNEQRERIAELEAEEKKKAQEIAAIEKQLFLLEEFTKREAGMIEANVNNKFSMARFRLFKTAINGGVEPTCDVLVNGVPFEDANKAAKVNVGLDIIRTLSKHFGLYVPIWIDDREGILSIIDVDTQIINLTASKKHKDITIEYEQKEVA